MMRTVSAVVAVGAAAWLCASSPSAFNISEHKYAGDRAAREAFANIEAKKPALKLPRTRSDLFAPGHMMMDRRASVHGAERFFDQVMGSAGSSSTSRPPASSRGAPPTARSLA
jgi:hypothetical protein